MKYDFDQLINRRDSDSDKWNHYNDKVLPLWVADMDFFSPQFIMDDLRKRIEHGVFGYSKVQDSTKEAVQLWLDKRHNWKVLLEDILILPGVVPGFNVAAKAVTNPGDSILFQTPAYHPFFNVASNSKTIQIENSLLCNKDGFYHIGKTHFTNAITEKTRLFLLCNPHNPTGRVFTKSELVDMANSCLKNNIIICSDEIHSDIVFSGNKHIPIASLSADIANNTITLLSASKTFNLAGLKSSVAVITNPKLRILFQAAAKGTLGSTNLLGETAMRSAYVNGKDWLQALLIYLEQNRGVLVDYINQNLPGIKIHTPEGSYLGWLDCTNTGLEDPAEYFLRESKVGLNSGSWFGADYKNFVRLNFGCPRERLIIGLDRMKVSLQKR